MTDLENCALELVQNMLEMRALKIRARTLNEKLSEHVKAGERKAVLIKSANKVIVIERGMTGIFSAHITDVVGETND